MKCRSPLPCHGALALTTFFAALSLAFPPSACAELPSVKLQTAALVTPTAAWSYYGTATTHTIGVAAPATTPPEIVELARALSQGGTCTSSCYATAVYEYVRNNIAVEFRFGLGKGARGAIIDQSGTPFDQASLMVALLRQGGVTASYQLGTITLSGNQVQTWMGFTNALGLCQYLADGGIPATVNGATSCTALSANATINSVVMAHIWVSALQGIYDPSYKVNIVTPGIGQAALDQALGCSGACGTTILNLIPAATYVGGSNLPLVQQVPAIQQVPQSKIEGALTGYAIKLQQFIQGQNTANNLTANPNMQVEDLLGGLKIDITQPVTNGTLLPTSAYSQNAAYTWAGDIPDPFRTTLTVQFAGINQLTYADETAGNRLRIFGTALKPTATSATLFATLYSEYRPIGSNYPNYLPNQTNSTTAITLYPLTLIVTHPYPTAGYLNETLTYQEPFLFNNGAALWTVSTITILQGWGDATESTVAHYSALVQRDASFVNYENLPPYSAQSPDPRQIILFYLGGTSKVAAQCHVRPASWSGGDSGCLELEQGPMAANWLAQASRGVRLAGAVNGVAIQLHHSLGAINSGPFTDGILTTNVQSSLSADSLTAVANDRSSAFFSATALLDRLEGSIAEQAGNQWEGGSAVSMMTKSNLSNYAFYDVTGANAATALGLLANNYPPASIQDIKAYTQANFQMILPQNGSAGTFCDSVGNCSYPYLFNGLVAYGPNSDRIAYLTDAPGWDKGSAGLSDPMDLITQTTTIQDYTAKKKKDFGVELQTGDVTINSPPDLVTGVGGFPYSLSYQRVYSSAAGTYGCAWVEFTYPCFRTETEISGLPLGWTDSLAITARLVNDGLASMGRNSALDASAVIAALYVARELYTSTPPSFQTNLATVFVINWLGENLAGNVVAVRRPPKRSAFVRLPDGSFNPEPGSAEILTQSGTRVYRDVNLFGIWTNSALSFSLTDAEGSTLAFTYGSDNAADYGYHSLYLPTTWTFPSGMQLTFSYSGPLVPSLEWARCLTKVSNNIGRSLSFNDLCTGGPNSAQTVTDDSGRVVTFSLSPAGLLGKTNQTTLAYAASDTPLVTSFLITAPDQVAITQHDYAPMPTGPANRNPYKVYDWLTPGNRTTPFITAQFDSLNRVSGITDNTSSTCCTTSYFLTGIYATENQRSAQIVDPLGEITTNYFDRWGSLLQSIDPLNLTTSYLYDTHRRKIQEILPELNGSSYQYDTRHNLTLTVRNPVPGSGTASTNTKYSYPPTCTNVATCNKPTSFTDGNNNATSYSWNSTGTLQSVTYPAVPEGTPSKSYQYNSFGMLTQKSELETTAPKSFVTQYNYNPSNDYTLLSVVVDLGGLALKTALTFDNGTAGSGPGNVATITDPNGNKTSFSFDAMRRLTQVSAPLAETTLYTYDLDSQLTSTQKWDSTRNAYQTEVRAYTPPGYLQSVISPNASSTAPTPSATTPAQSCPGNFITCYGYDLVGRLTTTTQPISATTTRVTQLVLDADGRKKTEYRGYGLSDQITYGQWTYTPNGKMQTAADADGNLTRYTYDGLDRLSQTIFPGGTCHTPWQSGDNCEQNLLYDGNDNLQTKQNRSGNQIGFVFDAMNRERQRTVPNNSAGQYARTVTSAYDLMGRPTSAAVTGADTQTLTFTYDTAGRMQTATDSILGSIGYTRDLNGNTTQLTWPGSASYATFAWDGLNRLCKVKESAATTCTAGDPLNSLAAQYSWDSLSRRQTLTFGNGVTAGYTYFNDSVVNTISHTIGAKSISISLGRNQVDQVTNQTLAVTDPSGGMNSANFTYEPSSTSPAVNYAPNALNQYSSVSGIAISYDLNGNLTNDGTFTYQYGEDNRLRSAVGSSYTVTYNYDPLGRRSAKTVNGTVTRFLSDGQEEIAEYSATNTLLRYYLNGHNIDEHLVQVEVSSGAHYYYSTNHEGSVLATTDGSLNIATVGYGPYGEGSTASTGVPFRYTGRRLDFETGLYYYRARYYSATTGRFLQPDSVGYKDDLNLYAYVGNDPLDKTDPTGMWCNKEGTLCTADTADFAKASVNVPHDSKVDAAVVEAGGDYQKAVKGGEPTGLAKVTSDGKVIVTPTASKAGQTLTADTAKVNIKDGDALVHGHLSGKVTDEPGSNKGFGDTQSLKAGKVTYTVEGKRVGVHDAVGGQLQFHMISGTMTKEEAAAIQENLNREQKNFQ